jgi:hypothetical protein
MTDDPLPECIRNMAEAARVPLRPDAPPRIARATASVKTRFAAENLAIPLEVEPVTFVVEQSKETGR